MRARNAVGEKDCTLALNFGGPLGDDENIPAKIYEQPELKQPDPATLILEAHVHANPRPKVLLEGFLALYFSFSSNKCVLEFQVIKFSQVLYTPPTMFRSSSKTSVSP